MSDPVRADSERSLSRAHRFLHARQKALYGDRDLLFEPEKSYRAFDAMLKRDMLYARFGVREIVAEARAGFGRARASLIVHRRPVSGSARAAVPGIDAFLRSKRLLPAPDGSPKRIDIGGRIYEAEVFDPGTDHAEIRLAALPRRAARGYRVSPGAACRTWFQALLAEWIGASGSLRLDGGPSRVVPGAGWTVSRRVSQVDVDLSSEDTPHAFRWKETSLAANSTYADLDEADIAAALEASGTALPANASLQGRIREDLGRGAGCLLLRYAHLVPDPDFRAGEGGAGAPPWMNAGSIVMENDYLEILLDAGSGKVFSEAWKWRPEGPAGPPGP